LKKFGVVKNMFKQNMKRLKKLQKLLMGSKRKQSKTEKSMECTFISN